MMNESEYNRKNKYGKAEFMSKNERAISFLNKYFIYKKRRNVDAITVAKNALSQTIDDELDEKDELTKIGDIIKETEIMKEETKETDEKSSTITKNKQKINVKSKEGTDTLGTNTKTKKTVKKKGKIKLIR